MKNIKSAYIVTAIVLVGMLSNYVAWFFIYRNSGWDPSHNTNISIGWTLWLIPVLAAIIIPARNFRRTVNLGGKRDNFFWGSLTIYALLAGTISIAVIVLDSVESFLVGNFNLGIVWTSAFVFGWGGYGIVAVFFQQFAFLFLFSAFVHTLSAIQDKWYGWVADVLVIAIISVFSPIAPLRAALVWFFNAILFESPILQIPFCMLLALAIYALNKPILARKAI
jgi:hypothetical protein